MSGWPEVNYDTKYNWLHISRYVLDRFGVDWKERDCGRGKSEGFLCRDKLKYRVLIMVVTETEIS